MATKLFEQQLHELKSAGFASASLGEWNKSGKRRVLITFDDGYSNVLRLGLEPLARVGFTAIQFLPVNFLGKSNDWDIAAGEKEERIMDASEVRSWISAGHEIGSHSLSHPFLTKVAHQTAREEIAASRKKLEDLFGRRVDHFCYPYGDWNEIVRDLVREAGYATACTTMPGLNAAGDSPFMLKRFTARYQSRNLKSMWALIRNGWGR
ncbi:MAG TPA: polysaccharide deacetylase family protein [Patescibacteria group bacterium]|nr:polysaccharide deacetylase family protein [Patescibacteria group bacterium]